jgi:hypothetical protein
MQWAELQPLQLTIIPLYLFVKKTVCEYIVGFYNFIPND